MNYPISYDGWDLDQWAKMTAGDMRAARRACEGFHDDVARTVRRYANQLQVRTHHYHLIGDSGKAPKDLAKAQPLSHSPYPQQLIDALDSAEAALAVAAAELEAYFSAADKRRRQARKAGVDVAV